MKTISSKVLRDLRSQYAPDPVPPCRVCGGALSIQAARMGTITYACSGEEEHPDMPGHIRSKPGRSVVDKHYTESRWEQFKVGDQRVIALLDAYEAAFKTTLQSSQTHAVDFSTLREAVDIHLDGIVEVRDSTFRDQKDALVYLHASSAHPRCEHWGELALNDVGENCHWLGLAAEGTDRKWLIPMAIVRKSFGAFEHETVFLTFGQKDGRGRMWVNDDVEGLDIERYEIDLDISLN